LKRRVHLKNAVALAAAFPFGAVQAQAWPSRPIKIIVPFTPGGTTDYVSRLIGVELAKALGQPVVIENKPGAGTIIGVDFVAKSPPDGYTFVCVANSFCVNHTLIKKLPYDTLKDFKPVALMGMSEHVLATHPGSGIKQIGDIATLAKRKANLSYASFGQGTSAHLAGEMLKAQLGLDITHVPYKGQAPALADLLGGQVSLMFGNWPEFRGHIQSGKLVALGMATAKRSSYAPQLPTLKEVGVNVESNSWNGLLAPADTPASIIAMMNTEVSKALNAHVVLEAFQKGGIASLAGSTAQFSEFIQSEIGRYGEIIRKATLAQKVNASAL
jgi:tripartite-type tricarboxylate transporter receptor subunit TctC